MLRPILITLLLSCTLSLAAGGAQARTVTAKIARVSTAVATLERVSVQLTWPRDAPQGQLRLRAERVEAPELGYRFRDLDWHCPLRRDGQGGWRCDGALRSGRGAPLQLSVALGTATTDAALRRGPARIGLHRSAAVPDVTRIDLTQVPLAWTQALLSQAWSAASITGGRLDSELAITAPPGQPLRIAGPLHLTDAAFDTADGSIAAEGLGAKLTIDAQLGDNDSVLVDGALHGGELLFGRTYISLQQRVVALQVEANRKGMQPWQLPSISWNDPGILSVVGSVALGPAAGVDSLAPRGRLALVTDETVARLHLPAGISSERRT